MNPAAIRPLRGASHRIAGLPRFRRRGSVSDVVGTIIEGNAPGAVLGSLCAVGADGGRESLLGEVVGFRGRSVLVMPYSELSGVYHGSSLEVLGTAFRIPVGGELLGRVVDGLGRPIDDGNPVEPEASISVYTENVSPMKRARIAEPLELGVQAMDGLLTCGQGQRLGIFSGAGVGKSTLMGMVAREVSADVNVIALIGERGREVREFIERDLGPAGMERSVVVAVTSDQSPVLRVKGAFVAMAFAEHFRAQGLHVVFMMDSLTRFAMAQREIGLAVGEPPTARGYTPSVFGLMPRLLESCGAMENGGSITGLFTVLVEGDDMRDPIADSARAILDGHVVLSRRLASRGHYPAIDVMASVSRVMRDVSEPGHIANAATVRRLMAVYAEAEEMIQIGAYRAGSNPAVDHAIEVMPAVEAFLTQAMDTSPTFDETLRALAELAARIDLQQLGGAAR